MPQQQNPWERDYTPPPVLRGMEGMGPEPIVPLRPRADAAPAATKANPWERDYAPPAVRYDMPEPPGAPRIAALQPGAPGPPTPATGLELTGAAFKGFVVNPLKGLWEMGKRVAQGPEETGRLAEEVWNAQLATGRRAAQAWKEGDRSSAVGYALGSLIPLLGPAAAGLGDRLGESFAKAQMDPSAANQKQLAEDLGEASNLILQAPMSRAAAPAIEMTRGGVVGGIKSVPKAAVSAAEGAMYGMVMGRPDVGAGIGALKTLREGVAKGAKEAWQSRQARLAATRKAHPPDDDGPGGGSPMPPSPAAAPSSAAVARGKTFVQPGSPPWRMPPEMRAEQAAKWRAAYQEQKAGMLARIRAQAAAQALPEPPLAPLPPNAPPAAPSFIPPGPGPWRMPPVTNEPPIPNVPKFDVSGTAAEAAATPAAAPAMSPEAAAAEAFMGDMPAVAKNPEAYELARKLKQEMEGTPFEEAGRAAKVQTLTDYIIRNKFPKRMIDKFEQKEWDMIAKQARVKPPSAETQAAIKERVAEMRKRPKKK